MGFKALCMAAIPVDFKTSLKHGPCADSNYKKNNEIAKELEYLG